MSITAAEVEANGWVLRLTVTGSAGTFGSYALDPNGTARLLLAASHPGFAPQGGQAVATPLARSLIGTAPLRRPVSFVAPTQKVIDETDLGGGQRRVRIALSEHVYATDTGLALTVLAGWRSGHPGQSGLAVTNGSTIVAPIPLMRWVRPSYDVAGGPFRVSLLVASHHPQGFQPVAAVRFTATDGTGSRSVWVTALDTDNDHGDQLRCHTAIIDPAGLNAGLLRIDAEVFPWLGAMRTTDPAGTRSLAGLRTDGWRVEAEAPHIVAHDPAGTRYGQMWCHVDPVNGSTAATAAMVQASLAAARALAPAAKPRDVRTALQAGYLANRTLAAANGQASQTRSLDGLAIVLPAGTSTMGTTAVTTGAATAEVAVRIIGDPDIADRRAQCILDPGAATSRISRALFRDCTILASSTGINIGGATYLAFDNVEVRGRPGSEANSTGQNSIAPPAGQFNVAWTRVRWWRHGSNAMSGNPRCGLIRASEHSRLVHALCYVKSRFIGQAEDGFTSGALQAWQGWPAATLAGQTEDIVIAWNDWRHLRGRAVGWTLLPAATAGTPNPSLRRHLLMGNVIEKVGADPQPLYSMGEDASATMSYNIVEANTHVAERANSFYADPLPVTLADCDSQTNQAFVNRVAGNAYDWLPTKHDEFFDSSTNALRAGTADAFKAGYRPQLIDAWSMLYGVGHEGNADTGRAAGGASFPLEFYGLRSVGNAGVLNPAFADDRSVLGSNTGGGSYTPGAGSVLLARVQRGNGDRDAAGAVRAAGSAAGAFAGAQGAVVGLAPAGGRSGQSAGQGAIGWSGGIMPAPARHGHRGGSVALGVRMGLAPGAARSPQRAAGAGLIAGAGLTPASTRQPQRAAAALLTTAAALAPAATWHLHGAAGPLLLTAAALAPGSAGHRQAAMAARLFPGFEAGLGPVLPVRLSPDTLSVPHA